jgi:hypothetical protein
MKKFLGVILIILVSTISFSTVNAMDDLSFEVTNYYHDPNVQVEMSDGRDPIHLGPGQSYSYPLAGLKQGDNLTIKIIGKPFVIIPVYKPDLDFDDGLKKVCIIPDKILAFYRL